MEADLTNLRKQRLISEREIPHGETSPRRLLALTKEGRHLLAATKTVPKDQAIYHGFTKPREAHHDADLYRLYQRGLEKANRDGGTKHTGSSRLRTQENPLPRSGACRTNSRFKHCQSRYS